jgi:hypothetical protein
MMSRILDIGISEDTPRWYGTLIDYFGLEIINDINMLR